MKHATNRSARRATKRARRNLHVPLPEEVYQRLRAQAERQDQPGTTLARRAIEAWLDEQARAARRDAIAAYAAGWAGATTDLDPELEAAAVDHLREDRDR